MAPCFRVKCSAVLLKNSLCGDALKRAVFLIKPSWCEFSRFARWYEFRFALPNFNSPLVVLIALGTRCAA